MAELTERVREARFTREVIGPKVARPLAGWLSTTFADEAEDQPADEQTALEPTALDGAAQDHAASETSDGAASDEVPSVDLSSDDLSRGETASDVASEIDTRPKGFVAVVKAVIARIKDHNLVVVAAGIAFWGLLAIPAVLFSTVSIAGLVLDPDKVEDQVKANLDGIPDDAKSIIIGQLENVSGGSTGGLITGLVLGLALALWSSSGAMAKIMATLNTIYGTIEGRSFAKLRGLALALTFGGIVFVAGAVFLLAVLPALLGQIDGVGDAAATLFNTLRFPVLGLVMVIALGVLYHVGPDRRNGRYRIITLGACVATVMWVGLSGLFSIYTATLGSYNETYGSLGGLVVLLLWLFITAFVVLIGAEIHALTGRETAGPGAGAGSSSAEGQS